MTAPRSTNPWPAALGAAVWLAVACSSVADLRGPGWSAALLTFAALVIVPLLLDIVGDGGDGTPSRWLISRVRRWQFPAAILLLAACQLPPGAIAAALALPWGLLTGLLALAGLDGLRQRGLNPGGWRCQQAGLVMSVVGGAWTLADRYGMRPLGFGTDIVQLTAVHFHYAGLALPVIAGRVLCAFPASRLAAAGGGAVLAGVPLVAVGITWGQLRGGTAGELAAALVLAPGAMIVAGFQLRLAGRSGSAGVVECLWVVAGTSLFFGMALALAYAARGQVLPLPWLNIPWMRALHGSMNAIGFGFCGTLAWWLAGRRSG